MAANTSQLSFGSFSTHDWNVCSNSRKISGRFSVRLFRTNTHEIHTKMYELQNFFPVTISTSNPSAHSIQLPPSNSTLTNAPNSNESMLVLLRHGESMWNEKNLFTGCVDVHLTIKGLAEAIGAGKRISKVPIDLIYTSSLIRAQMTAVIAMTQHSSKKVPIIVHNESEQAKIWSEIHSETAIKESISVITAWQHNERMYGDLQGLNKQEIAKKLGHDVIVHAWRRTCFTRPPNGESLEMCGERAVSYFTENDLSFWHSPWAKQGMILSSVVDYNLRRSSGISEQAKVEEFMHDDGIVLPYSNSYQLRNLWNDIMGKPTINNDNVLIWSGKGEHHSIKLVYNALCQNGYQFPWHSRIWNIGGSAKENLLLWKVMANALNTKDKLCKMGIISEDLCVLCKSETESNTHLFFDCTFVYQIWYRLLSNVGFYRPSPVSLVEWFNVFKATRWKTHKTRLLLKLLKKLIHAIWSERNDRVFGKGCKNVAQLYN